MGKSLLFARTFAMSHRLSAFPMVWQINSASTESHCAAQSSSPIIGFVYNVSGGFQKQGSWGHQVWIATH
jgi:hypothetical protein